MKQRLEWLDIMKGFTIVLVVLGHVLNSQGLFNHPVNIWLHYFHMPFFFLLSGFLAIHALKRNFLSNVQKKFISLIFPFLSCGILYSLTLNNISTFITDLHHGGYWFLLSLFTCWILFFSVMKILTPPLMQKYVIEIVALLSPFFLGNLLMKYLSEEMLNLTAFPLTFSYYRFFILGYFIGKINQDETLKERLKLANKRTIFTACSIVLFMLASLLILTQKTFITAIPTTVWQVVFCVTLFFILYKSDSFIHPDLSKLLCYFGRNSLAIYVFHTFFVYEFEFKNFVQLLPQSFQFLFGICITIIVLVATLTLAAFFRNNKYLSLLFLGQKK